MDDNSPVSSVVEMGEIIGIGDAQEDWSSDSKQAQGFVNVTSMTATNCMNYS